MYEEKAAIASKSIQGAVIAVAAGVAATLQGLGITEAGAIPEAVIGVVAAVGGIYSLIGRIAAQAKISGIFFK